MFIEEGLFVATGSFVHILAFSVVFDCFEPLKPLVSMSWPFQ